MRWKGVPSGKARGRPRKAPEDLSATYRLKLEGAERLKARILAGMKKGQAQEAERKASTKRRKAEKKKEKNEIQLRKHGGQGLGGAARQTTREEDARQFRGTLQPSKRGLPAAGRGKSGKKGKGLSKKTKAACRAGDARGEASGMGEGEEGRECAVHGCTRAATHPA